MTPDLWNLDAYDEIENFSEFIENYDVVIFYSYYTQIDYKDELRVWFDQGGKGLVAIGDEILGLEFGWPGSPLDLTSGNFYYDIFGIQTYYPDINENSSGISRLMAVENDSISGDLYNYLNQNNLYLNYNPYEFTGNSNWIDGLGINDNATTFLKAYAGIVEQSDSPDPTNTTIYSCAIYSEASSGSRSAFFALDATALFAENSTESNWLVNSEANIMGPVISWVSEAEVLSLNENLVIPEKYTLYQNYPNPFNPITTLRYDLPENGHVNITIYDMLGRQVKTLINQTQDAGYRSVIWDATNNYGKPVSAGIYLYQIQAGEYMQTKKMVLLK